MNKGANNNYFGNIWEGISSLSKGLGLTFKHFLNFNHKRQPIGVEDKNYFEQDKGIVTLEYPHEAIPIPDHGRYRLHNEIDDCIVCDLCAKICPVNCIEIDAIKSTEEIGKTSDGTTKRLYAGTFNIDMAKCCYCGLCTTVCPTECLTMTKTYDYSEFDIRNMVYHFTDLTPAQADQKKKLYEEQQKEKEREKLKAKEEAEKAKAAAAAEVKKDPSAGTEVKDTPPAPEVKKPVFKPVIKPVIPKKNPDQDNDKKE
jgi:formate hydrogenlyase subunit 6/NADH:ubiquinone oxidoreductase subunit I